MKTSELIKKINKLGLDTSVEQISGNTYIDVNANGCEICEFSSKDTSWFDVETRPIGFYITEESLATLSKVISKYLATPLKEREPEKKYRVRLQGFNQGDHQYLSTDSNPYMGQIFASTWDPCYKQVFTKGELEAIQNRPQFKGVVWFRELIKDGLREFNGDDNE